MAVVFAPKWSTARVFLMSFFCSLFLFVVVSGARSLQNEALMLNDGEDTGSNHVLQAIISLWPTKHAKQSCYQRVWPELKFGWQIVVGSVIGFFGAAFGSVVGVGCGGIFVPMLYLIIGFDKKSSIAISKCMIMGAAASTGCYNLRQWYPRLDMSMVDYDLVLIIQPMLMLGISIGVTFNVIFPDWIVTILSFLLYTGTSVEAFFKGVKTWERETVPSRKQEDAKLLEESCGELIQATILENNRWKELALLSFVWVAYLAVQIAKNYTATYSTSYWLINLLQVPVSVGVFLYKGRRVIASKGNEGTNWKVYQLVLCAAYFIIAGILDGLLGIREGFVMRPLFLQLGVTPQVGRATAKFEMIFSSSMSTVEDGLLNRFPVLYALYFIVVSIIAALVGQHIVRKLIDLTRRKSIIIFVLAFTICVSAISLGWVGISSIIGKIKHNEYMGFEDLCKYKG